MISLLVAQLSGQPALSARNCPDLDVPAVRSLVARDVADAPGVSDRAIELTCDPSGKVRVDIRDASGKIRQSRVLSLDEVTPPLVPRLIAAAAVELLLAGPEPEPEPPPQPEPTPRPRPEPPQDLAAARLAVEGRFLLYTADTLFLGGGEARLRVGPLDLGLSAAVSSSQDLGLGSGRAWQATLLVQWPVLCAGNPHSRVCLAVRGELGAVGVSVSSDQSGVETRDATALIYGGGLALASTWRVADQPFTVGLAASWNAGLEVTSAGQQRLEISGLSVGMSVGWPFWF